MTTLYTPNAESHAGKMRGNPPLGNSTLVDVVSIRPPVLKIGYTEPMMSSNEILESPPGKSGIHFNLLRNDVSRGSQTRPEHRSRDPFEELTSFEEKRTCRGRQRGFRSVMSEESQRNPIRLSCVREAAKRVVERITLNVLPSA